MNSRLGIACLTAFALTSLVAAGCSHGTSSTVAPIPSPSPSGSPAPDTLYVQTSASKQIRVYKGASALNGLGVATAIYPTGDISNGDVIYNPTSDTLWYATAFPGGANSNQAIDMWSAASTQNGMNPNPVVPFQYGEGTQAFDPTHHLLFVATTQGPQVSVYANPETMSAAATPAAVITMNITDTGGPTPRPQEMYYDPVNDRLFASDQLTEVAVFDGFGTAANNAVIGHTNPVIAPNRYMSGLYSPDGLAYSPSSDVLFIGEQFTTGQIDVVHSASTFTGGVSHTQVITGFAKPGGLAFDDVRNLLYVYDTSPIYVIPNGITASGALSFIVGLHQIQDSTASQNSGFGIYVDITH